MEKERKYKLMWRWFLVTAGAIALFWAIWYLIAGQVPTVTSIKMTPDWTWQLPFGISHWWDILIGPIWSIILISFFTSKIIKKDGDLVAGLAFALAFALAVALAVGLAVGLGTGLVAGVAGVAGVGADLDVRPEDVRLGIGLVFGLAVALVAGLAGLVAGLGVGLGAGRGAGLVFGLVFSLAVALVFGLAVGLVFGLAVGLVFGLVFGLVAGLGAGLGVGLVVILKWIFSKDFWKTTGNWLTARDIHQTAKAEKV